MPEGGDLSLKYEDGFMFMDKLQFDTIYVHMLIQLYIIHYIEERVSEMLHLEHSFIWC